MMTENTIASINQLFEDSLRATTPTGSEDGCTITFRSDMPLIEENEHCLVVLTLSSYCFRIVTLSNFNKDAATAIHLTKVTRSTQTLLEGQVLAGQALLDAYAEFLNMMCGGVNRSLNIAFPDTGMSTPFILEHSCLQHIATLHPSHVQYMDVVINESVRFTLTVCICLSQENALDFRIERSTQENHASGELELF